MSLFCFGMALYALTTGTLIMKKPYPKATHPGTYWLGIATYLCLGVAGLFLAMKSH